MFAVIISACGKFFAQCFKKMVQSVPSLGCGMVGNIRLLQLSHKEVRSLSPMLLVCAVFHILVIRSDLLIV
jgi:hypothetical protein